MFFCRLFLFNLLLQCTSCLVLTAVEQYGPTSSLESRSQNLIFAQPGGPSENYFLLLPKNIFDSETKKTSIKKVQRLKARTVFKKVGTNG